MFTLTASMVTGIPAIDAEHRELVDLINAIAAAERRNHRDDALAALDRFRQALELHFQHEEAYVERVRFPGGEAHAATRAAALRRLEEIRETYATEAEPPVDTATICFDELLRAVLQQDLEVVNWEADSKLLMK